MLIPGELPIRHEATVCLAPEIPALEIAISIERIGIARTIEVELLERDLIDRPVVEEAERGALAKLLCDTKRPV